MAGLPALKPCELNAATPARDALNGILVFASSRQTLRLDHSDMERELKDRGRAALCRVYQWWLDQLAPGRALDPVVDADGQRRTPKRQLQIRKLLTQFGLVYVTRTAYGAPGKASLHPLDAQLNLPPELYSHELRRYVARQASQSSFEETMATLEEYTGTHIGKRQLEQSVHRAARDFDAFYDLRHQEGGAVGDDSGSIMVLTSDAKGIPVYTCDLRPETRKKAEQQVRKLTTRLTKGEKPHHKRMAMVTAVYTIAPYRRSPEQVFADLSRQPVTGDRPPRPRPESKRVAASLVETTEPMLAAAFREALSRDPDRQKTWAAVVDGDDTQLEVLKKLARKHKAKLTIVLDIIHVLEYVWGAGRAFHRAGTEDLEDWVLQRLRRILRGDAGQVAGGMRRSATKRGFSDEEAAPVEKCAKYLINHKRNLDYPRYLKAGLPIGTGVIEGTVRHLINDRMLLTGARWRLVSSEAVLRLRALRISQDFDEYWYFHEAQEYARNHQELYHDAVVPQTRYASPPPEVMQAQKDLRAADPHAVNQSEVERSERLK